MKPIVCKMPGCEHVQCVAIHPKHILEGKPVPCTDCNQKEEVENWKEDK